MKTLESMNYRGQDFDRCENCKHMELGYEGTCECTKIPEEEDENGCYAERWVLKASICDEYERGTK